MIDPFVIEGYLVLSWEPGNDGWYMGETDLADLVAAHFGITEREKPSGNRTIGMARVTVEKLKEVYP